MPLPLGAVFAAISIDSATAINACSFISSKCFTDIVIKLFYQNVRLSNTFGNLKKRLFFVFRWYFVPGLLID